MPLHFIRPAFLLALIPAICYISWVIYCIKLYNPWKKVCDPHLLSALLQPGKQTSRRITNLTLALFYMIAITALAGPSWKKITLPVFRDVGSLMLVLDLSDYMLATDLKPDRLTRAKYKIRDLIKASPNTQMGLVTFTKEAFTASPLSQDANTLNGLLDELNPEMMPVTGSDIAEGLNQGLSLLKQAGAEQANLLLITASDPTSASFVAAKKIAESGSHLNILAVLDSNSSTAEIRDHLNQLAQTGNGNFYPFSTDDTDIQGITNLPQIKQIMKDDKIENAYLWQDAGPWFCLLLIPLGLILLREKAQYEKHR